MPNYDAIIIGAGIAGSIMAHELAKQKKYVLLLEAGPKDISSRQDFLNSYYTDQIKLPESPYPPLYDDNESRDATRMPRLLNAPRYTSLMQFNWPSFSDRGTPKWEHQIEKVFNPFSHVTADADSEIPLLSTYERLVGGTTWHWLGTCLRLLPNDFKTKTRYGFGIDWPLGYEDLHDDYALAEHAIGVSADVNKQQYLGLYFDDQYAYPMPAVDSSYSDLQLNKLMAGLELDFDGEMLMPSVNNTPQGRNSIDHDGRPACRGNNSCIPICPIEAKYDATVTLRKALSLLDPSNRPYVELMPMTVAYNLNLDANKKVVTSVDTKTYDKEIGGTVKENTYTAPVIIVAAHAIETARLLLNSNKQIIDGVANTSKQVGRNLMDHIVYLSWGLSAKATPLFPFRGPRSSSGIESLRDGNFRSKYAAFRVDIGNEGWGWADDDPTTVTRDFIKGSNDSGVNPGKKSYHGKELAAAINDVITRMMRFCFLVEQEPDPENRVRLDDDQFDGLGIRRPKTKYKLSGYTKRGLKSAVEKSQAIFDYSGIQPFTQFHDFETAVQYDPDDPNGYCNVFGAGHIMGTYRMGTDKTTSVVNADSQSHDHPNLFLLGSGTFPTVGTANPTLTIAALAFKASRAVLKQLA